jgi:hypothetical protein
MAGIVDGAGGGPTGGDASKKFGGAAFAPVAPPALEGGARRSAESKARLRVLFLCDYNLKTAAAVCDFINAFVRYSSFDIVVLHWKGKFPPTLKLHDFDVLAVHYSLTLALESYIPFKARQRMAAFKGLKVLFIQDEYRFIDRTSAAIRETGIHVVFSVMPQEEIVKIYPADLRETVRFETILTGYIPDWLTIYKPVPYRKRSIDVSYRGRSYPAWHGTPGRERQFIGSRFLKDSKAHNLKCDIRWDERSRLYGAAWVDLLQASKAQLCTESAIGVFDHDGTISARTETYVDLLYDDRQKADLTDAAYNELREKFFKDAEGLINTAVLSPRALEAVAIRTLLIMYEGHYSGVFVPWRHYVPLKKDHSNMDEVVAVLRDEKRAAEIITNAFAEIALNPDYSFKSLTKRFDNVLLAEIKPHMRSPTPDFNPEIEQEKAPVQFADNPHGLRHLTIRRPVEFVRYRLMAIVKKLTRRLR